MSASADPHYAIVDADVGWFRRHPRRRHRVGVLINAQIAAGYALTVTDTSAYRFGASIN
jgi:hypothetical protein